MTYKRDNWTNDEVIALLRDCKLSLGGVRKDAFCTAHNEGVDSCMDKFLDFRRPEDQPGAMAYVVETGEVVHIGPMLPR